MNRRASGALAGVSRSPFVIAAVACLAIAALSAAILPTVPSYDPWSWIVWGREVFDPHLSFAIGGGPSWKPLPFLFTALYGPLGGAAPTLWVITARAGGLLGLVAGYRLASMLTRRWALEPVWLPVVAGSLAVAGIVLTQDWAYYMFRGTSEPMLLGASLWAIDRHLAGKRMEAFGLGVAASLIRPEAWPFIGLYAIWLWRLDRRPARRVGLGLGLAAIPFLWFVPPWVGSGQPLLAASHAKAYNGHLGSDPFLEVLRRGADLQLVPLLVAAVALAAWSWSRDRDRLPAALALGALGWWVLVVAMTLAGYPGLERFFLPAAGIACVLGGAAVARLAGLLGGRLPGARAVLAVGVVLGFAVFAALISPRRIHDTRAQPHLASQAVTRLDQLAAAAKAVGGHQGVYPCRSSFAAVNHGVQTALAWKLHVTLGRVGTSLHHQGVLFVGPHDAIDGAPAPVPPRFDRRQLIATVGVWQVYRVGRTGHLGRCVGA
jgi:hypothetical protein